MDLLKLQEYQERSYAEMPSPHGYIKYGDDNLYPQYLIDLYQSSATHNALCTSIAYMIFGDGVQADRQRVAALVEHQVRDIHQHARQKDVPPHSV